jgi:hypothetical protein
MRETPKLSRGLQRRWRPAQRCEEIALEGGDGILCGGRGELEPKCNKKERDSWVGKLGARGRVGGRWKEGRLRSVAGWTWSTSDEKGNLEGAAYYVIFYASLGSEYHLLLLLKVKEAHATSQLLKALFKELLATFPDSAESRQE